MARGRGRGKHDRPSRIAFLKTADEAHGGHRFPDADRMDPDRMIQATQGRGIPPAEYSQALEKASVQPSPATQVQNVKRQIQQKNKGKQQVVEQHHHGRSPFPNLHQAVLPHTACRQSVEPPLTFVDSALQCAFAVIPRSTDVGVRAVMAARDHHAADPIVRTIRTAVGMAVRPDAGRSTARGYDGKPPKRHTGRFRLMNSHASRAR